MGNPAQGISPLTDPFPVRADGTRRLVSVSNTPIRRGDVVDGVLGVARDVTEERERAVALEKTSEITPDSLPERVVHGGESLHATPGAIDLPRDGIDMQAIGPVHGG